jgi:hypothetical protein
VAVDDTLRKIKMKTIDGRPTNRTAKYDAESETWTTFGNTPIFPISAIHYVRPDVERIQALKEALTGRYIGHPVHGKLDGIENLLCASEGHFERLLFDFLDTTDVVNVQHATAMGYHADRRQRIVHEYLPY